MNISAVSNASTQALQQVKSEDLVEGNKPDGDGDQDDVNATISSTSQVTAAVGNNINVSA